MNAGKLIRELEKKQPQKQVLITWEGIFRHINVSNIYEAPDGTVILDADENFYKKSIINGNKRAIG